MTPFGLLEREDASTTAGPLRSSGEPRFSCRLGEIAAGTGEPLSAASAPFARFVARRSYEIGGDGATALFTALTDTSTRSSGRTDDSKVDDQ